MEESRLSGCVFSHPVLRRVILALIFILAIGVRLMDLTDLALDISLTRQLFSALKQQLGHDTAVVGITQHYGYRAAYWGWINIHSWPSLADQSSHVLSGGSEQQFASIFAEYAAGKQFFLNTDFDEFADQTELAAYLDEKFPLYASGDAYLVYDLRGSP